MRPVPLDLEVAEDLLLQGARPDAGRAKGAATRTIDSSPFGLPGMGLGVADTSLPSIQRRVRPRARTKNRRASPAPAARRRRSGSGPARFHPRESQGVES